MGFEMKTKLMQLADAYAHCYAFVKDESMPIARAALLEEVDRVSKDAEKYAWLKARPQWLGWDEDFSPDDIDAIVTRAMKEP